MSHIKFDKPLQIDLAFSIQHKTFLYVIYFLAAMLLCLPFGLPMAIKVFIFTCVGISFYVIIKNTKQLYSGSLHYLDNNNWSWVNKKSENKLQLHHGIIIQPRLLILTFIDLKGKKYCWTLFSDITDKETFRRTRILLRHSTAETHSSPV